MCVPRTPSRDRERQGSCLIGGARFGQDTRRLHPRAAVRVAARRAHGGLRDRDRILSPTALAVRALAATVLRAACH